MSGFALSVFYRTDVPEMRSEELIPRTLCGRDEGNNLSLEPSVVETKGRTYPLNPLW